MNNLDALIKASLYLGAILLIGAGCYGLFIAGVRTRALLIYSGLGFVLLSLSSSAQLVKTVFNILGRFDSEFIWQYAINTQHGNMTFIRMGLATGLLALISLPRWPIVRNVLFSLASLGILSTFSTLSHATTMQGTPGLLADLIHFSSATLWVGAIGFSVLHQVWKHGDFEVIIKRISSLALTCVVLLIGTGIYAGNIHIKTLESLFATTYGGILVVKVSLLVVILILASINRWYFMPQLLAKQQPFKRILIVEALLLVLTILVTGLLSVSPVPHEM
jgi:putative copper export protein